MSRYLCCMLAISLWLAPAAPLRAAEMSSDEALSLDGEVQEIKADVLSIASELRGLEERLLFPSNTQVALFVSMTEGDPFRLDAVRITIDGELAAHHIYSFNELEALRKGGVQRIFTGNVATGEHALDVSMIGVLGSGEEFSTSGVFRFTKEVEPEAIAIYLRNPGGGNSGISVGEW